MGVEIRIERARCIATKACMSAAPGVFRLDDTLVATVVDAAGASEEEIIEAAESCPTGAIVVSKDGERLV